MADGVCVDRAAEVRITDYEVDNWKTFWFRWAYNSSIQRDSDRTDYDGWFRNRCCADSIELLKLTLI